MHTGLPEYRLSAALSHLVDRTRQVEAIRDNDWTLTWRYKAVTTNEQHKPIPAYWQATIDQIVEVMRTRGKPEAEWTVGGLSNYINCSPEHLQSALNVAQRAGVVKETYQNWAASFYRLAKPAFPPHIDIVINAIRASGGSADREAIWGRSPGLTWEQVDRAIETAEWGHHLQGWFTLVDGEERRTWTVSCHHPHGRDDVSIPVLHYGAVADAPSFNKPAVLRALLCGHGGGGVTDAHIEAAYTWAATAPKELLALVEHGDLSIQWQPMTKTMHYFANREAA